MSPTWAFTPVSPELTPVSSVLKYAFVISISLAKQTCALQAEVIKLYMHQYTYICVVLMRYY